MIGVEVNPAPALNGDGLGWWRTMNKRDEQAITAVRLYFERGMSQAEVATAMGLSRPTVAKLLQRGKDAGFVTIEIYDPRETSSEVAARLMERFGLVEARIIHSPVDTDAELLGELGRVGAELVTDLVVDGMKVGISWGQTMYALSSCLHRTFKRDVEIIQLKGGSSYSDQATNDFEIMKSFCEAFNAMPHYLPLPVIFQNVETLEIVKRDPHIAMSLEAGRNVDLAVFTVGGVAKESLALNLGQLGEADIHQLLEHAVGDACSRFFAADGGIAVPSIDERTAGISLEDLAARPTRVLVAGGQKKAIALLTALRMGLATHLVTDQKLAITLLRADEESR